MPFLLVRILRHFAFLASFPSMGLDGGELLCGGSWRCGGVRHGGGVVWWCGVLFDIFGMSSSSHVGPMTVMEISKLPLCTTTTSFCTVFSSALLAREKKLCSSLFFLLYTTLSSNFLLCSLFLSAGSWQQLSCNYYYKRQFLSLALTIYALYICLLVPFSPLFFICLSLLYLHPSYILYDNSDPCLPWDRKEVEQADISKLHGDRPGTDRQGGGGGDGSGGS